MAIAVAEAAFLAVLVAVLLAVLTPLPWYAAAALAAVLAAGTMWWWCRSTPGRALKALAAQPADEVRHARYVNLVEGLCLSFGVERPSLHVIADDALNAGSLAGPGGAHLFVTDGLLRHLDRVQLEGALAHELAHIRSGDAAEATLGVAVVGYPLLGGRGPVGRLLRPVGDALEPARQALWRWSLGCERELVADQVAVGVTRYPPGLYAALTAIRDHPAAVGSASPATLPLWIHPPQGAPCRTSGPTVHPPIDERIDVLGEL